MTKSNSNAPETPKTVAGARATLPAGIKGEVPKSCYETHKVTGTPMGVKQVEGK